MKKLLLGLTFVFAFLLVSAAPKPAEAMTCAWVNPLTGQCAAWMPDPPPGGYYCSGTNVPSGEVWVYTGANQTGWCIAYRWGNSMLSNSANGWYSPFYVYSFKVGANARIGCYLGDNWTDPQIWVNTSGSYNYPSGCKGVYTPKPGGF